jgi:amidohydrolase
MCEHRSAAKVARLAADAGFEVALGTAGLPTALTAVRGSGPLTIAVCAEYDALPGIGHACGHNVHGAGAVGAALALGALVDDLAITVKLLGTPAEEGEGGKITMLEAGVFDDVHAALMTHSAGHDSVGNGSLALHGWDVEFTGRPAHSAVSPWEGINALDAAAISYTAIGVLRQQLPPGTVVSFTVSEGGGAAANVIPSRVLAHVEVRTPTTAQLEAVQARVRACLEAGALATGARLDIRPRGRAFAELRQDAFLSSAYADALRRLGRDVTDASGEIYGSTDMGNVSQAVASIHPTIGYDVEGAAFHSPEFAGHGCSPSADRAVVDAAIALAWTAIGAATDTGQRRRLTARST